MHIVLSSIFRNSTGYLPRYVNQVTRLFMELRLLNHSLELLLVEGDSTDRTWLDLSATLDIFNAAYNVPGRLIPRSHGGPLFGSIDDEQRWRNISYACNGIFENLPAEFDALIYVESDLIWSPAVMLALLEDLADVPAVAPLSLYDGDKFYDIWGYRRNEIRFQPAYPYHPDLLGPPDIGDHLYQIDSAGSCIALRAEVARLSRFAYPEIGILGFCKSIYDAGHALYIDPQQHVTHPW